MLHQIKMWMECPVEATDDRGRKTRTTEARDKRRGIPQGSPLSPLLSRSALGQKAGRRGGLSELNLVLINHGLFHTPNPFFNAGITLD